MSKPDAYLAKLLSKALKTQSKTIVHRLPSNKKQNKKNSLNKKSQVNAANCRACDFFYVTWDTKRPFGCKAHNFKSLQLPSAVVLSTSGKKCLLFKPKK